MKASLSQALINGFTLPEGKAKIELRSDELKGFVYEIRNTTPVGNGTYYIRVTLDGKARALKICKANERSLHEAMAIALEWKSLAKQGIDPTKQSNNDNNEMSYREFMTKVFFPYQEQRIKTNRYYSLWNCRLNAKFGDYPLSGFSKKELVEFHMSLLHEGLSHASADHYIKLIRSSLGIAVEFEYLSNNPADKFKLFNKDNSRSLNYTDEDLAKIVTKLKTDPARAACGIFLLSLATSARTGECYTAVWENFDLERKQWHIPTTKNGEPRTVPLSPFAIEVLTGLSTYGNEHGPLFISEKTGQPLRWYQKTFNRIRRELEMPDLQAYDMRSIAITMMVRSGLSIHQVSKIAGHKNSAITEQRYARLQSGTLAHATNAIGDRIDEILAKSA